MRVLVQVDVLHLLASDNDTVVDGDAEILFNLPVMLGLVSSQVEQCICPANTTGLSCQVCFSLTYYLYGHSCFHIQPYNEW